ncbi:alpha/beta fold hydrolase [Celeribacter sp.]|uniref:alpha/beta fold hydrolase n=1 Tax=Celeribacter sp. TaxID=1890673 RepID=UPI003A948204
MSDALVFLPGFLADGRIFADQVSGLSRDFAVMVAPLKGESVTDMAEHVLAHAPPRFSVAGHDLGASVAAEVLRRAPDRVERIALICANAQSEPPNAAAAREPRMVRAKSGRLGEVLLEDLPIGALAESPHRNAIRDYWIDMALEAGIETYLHQSRVMQRRPDQQNILRRARLPALVVGGQHDTVCPPRRQDFISQLMPRAHLEIIEGAGHLPMLETPQTVTRILRTWLQAPAPLVLT